MTAFVFILIYYLGKPVFSSFGVTERNHAFTALALGLIFETIVFFYYGYFRLQAGWRVDF